MRSRFEPDRQLTARMAVTMFLLGLVYVAFIAALIVLLKSVVLVVVIAAGLLLAQFWYSDRIALYAMHGRLVTPEEEPRLHGVIDRLSRGSSIRVISRLSTAPFRERPMDLGALHAYLGATFVLSGGYALSGTKLLITAELSTVEDAQVLWTERLTGSLDDLFDPDSHLAKPP